MIEAIFLVFGFERTVEGALSKSCDMSNLYNNLHHDDVKNFSWPVLVLPIILMAISFPQSY